MKTNSIPSRRSFLKVGAATVASTGALATAAVAAHQGLDAELMSMAEPFDSLRRKVEELRPYYDRSLEEASAAFARWQETEGFPCPVKGSAMYPAWWEAHRRAYEQADNHPINGVMDEMNPLAERIMKLQAYTLPGLALKARHALECLFSPKDLDSRREDLDYNKEAVLSLAEDLCRLVGLDTYGRPLSRREG